MKKQSNEIKEIDLIKEIRCRRSIRNFLSKEIEECKLLRILEAGRLAPTAKNSQDWRIIIIDNPEKKKLLIDAASPQQQFLYKAPIILMACGTNPNYIMRCGHPSYLIDLAIVLDHISLQATREGLGTCWIGSFEENQAKKILNLPDHVRIVELMSLGYPESQPKPTKRKEIVELYSWNKW